MKKQQPILVKFNCTIGDYEHTISSLFDKRLSNYQYCKKFWGLSKKNKLKNNVYWDDWTMNTIEVLSVKELTDRQYDTVFKLGLA